MSSQTLVRGVCVCDRDRGLFLYTKLQCKIRSYPRSQFTNLKATALEKCMAMPMSQCCLPATCSVLWQSKFINESKRNHVNGHLPVLYSHRP